MTSEPAQTEPAPSSLRASTWSMSAVAGGLFVLILFRAAAFIDRAWLSAIPAWFSFSVFFVLPLVFLFVYPLITRQPRTTSIFRWPSAQHLVQEAVIAIPMVVACLVLVALVHFAITILFPDTPEAPEQIERMSRSTGGPYAYMFLLFAFSFGPAAEEIFFRGFLFNVFRRRMHLWLAIMLQSAIFGFSHFYGVAHSLEVTILGCFFTLLYCWRDTLLSPIFVHAGYNAVVALVVFSAMVANAHGPILGVVRDTSASTCKIADTTPGSPAAAAGLRAGDTITAVDDHPIGDFNSLFDTLRLNYSPGDTVVITVTRLDETLELEVTLAARSSLPEDE